MDFVDIKKTKLVQFENTAVVVQMKYIESTMHANLFRETFSVPDAYIDVANYGSLNQRKLIEMVHQDSARTVVQTIYQNHWDLLPTLSFDENWWKRAKKIISDAKQVRADLTVKYSVYAILLAWPIVPDDDFIKRAIRLCISKKNQLVVGQLRINVQLMKDEKS